MDKSVNFEIGKYYSRLQIASAVGGSPQSSRPTVGGEPRSLCVRKSLNPSAPEWVYVGRTPGLVDLAKGLVRAEVAVPMFVAPDVPDEIGPAMEGWRYVGLRKDTAIVTDRDAMDEAEALSGRLDLARLLRCE